MNLKQYVTENPDATVEQARACEDIIDTISDVTKNNAFNHDARFGVSEIMSAIHNDTNSSAELKVITRIYANIMDGKLDNINMMDSTAQYSLDVLVADGRYTQAMRDNIEGYAKVFPFKEVTQEELDGARLETSLYVDTPHTLVGYPQLDDGNTNAVILTNKKVRITAMLAAAQPVDVKVDVFAHVDDTNTKTFTSVGYKLFTITIPAGQLSKNTTVSKGQLSTYCQFSSIANVSGEHNLIVATV
mgnify:CR=1 FL=1